MTKRSPKNTPNPPAGPGGASAPPPVTSAGDRLLTRAQAAALLGTSVSSIRRLEGGVLEPVVDAKGVHHFRESQVREFTSREKRETAGPETYDGTMAAAAFDLFERARHPVDAVRELKLDPRAVEALHREWARLRGGLVVSAEVAAKIWQEVQGPYPYESDAQLLQAIRRVKNACCRGCGQAGADLCLYCSKGIAPEIVAQWILELHEHAAKSQQARLERDLHAQAHEQLIREQKPAS